MNYLLDTNILSEAKRKKPNERVLGWLSSQDAASSYISVISLGEIEEGISYLGKTKKAADLRLWLEALSESFSGRILDLDRDVLLLWGKLRDRAKLRGEVLPVINSLLAATALHHNLTLVSRNAADFEKTDVQLLNPWLER